MDNLEQIKQNFADNLSALRKGAGLTQLELADKLKYSDKAISKWERGESVPDVAVLKFIAETFGVSVDYLIEGEHLSRVDKTSPTFRQTAINRAIITAISVAVVWLVALTVYVTASMATDGAIRLWQVFVYAVPVSSIVWLVFNSIWFNRRVNFLIISLLIWSVLTVMYISINPHSGRAWELFLLGIPGQVIVIFWSRIKNPIKKLKSRK